jgi:hypothetical protein
MEQVVDRLRRLVDFITLDVLHRLMRAVLHRHTAMAIEMARDRGAFVCRCRLF